MRSLGQGSPGRGPYIVNEHSNAVGTPPQLACGEEGSCPLYGTRVQVLKRVRPQ
jgi:hypothetical protein